MHSKKSPHNDSKFSQTLINFPNYVYLCRNESAQEAPDSKVFIVLPLINARYGIFKNTSSSKCTTKTDGLYLPRVHGQSGVRLVWRTQSMRSVSRKAVRKRHMEGSHNVTSHFSLYHASLLYRYQIKDMLSVISP